MDPHPPLEHACPCHVTSCRAGIAASPDALAMPHPPDVRALRDVLGAFATGVTVVTTVGPDGRRHGMTANSFCSVSLDPPLVLWNQSLAAPSYPAFRDAPRFAINILAEEQLALSRRFAGAAPAGVDKFDGIALRPGMGGVPLLAGCVAWIECTVETRFPGGDHAVHVGRVARAERAGPADRDRPLLFAGGRYLGARPHAAADGR